MRFFGSSNQPAGSAALGADIANPAENESKKDRMRVLKALWAWIFLQVLGCVFTAYCFFIGGPFYHHDVGGAIVLVLTSFGFLSVICVTLAGLFLFETSSKSGRKWLQDKKNPVIYTLLGGAAAALSSIPAFIIVGTHAGTTGLDPVWCMAGVVCDVVILAFAITNIIAIRRPSGSGGGDIEMLPWANGPFAPPSGLPAGRLPAGRPPADGSSAGRSRVLTV